MTKLTLLAAILLSGMLCLTGCGGSDSDDSSAAAAAPAAPAAPAGDAGDALGDPPVDPNAAADAAFAEITPTGLVQTDKFVIAGRGTVFSIKCDAVAGAVSYTFTTSFGGSTTSATPSVDLQGTIADGGRPYKASVYATNANGARTKSKGTSLN